MQFCSFYVFAFLLLLFNAGRGGGLAQFLRSLVVNDIPVCMFDHDSKEFFFCVKLVFSISFFTVTNRI